VAGFTLATEVADWLARRGVPFATAHEITGALVKRCEELKVGLAEISDAELVAVDHRLTPDVKSCLTPQAAVAARSGHGGTAPARVREQLERLAARLDTQRRWAVSYAGPRG
jgi:argininosuccinate lyase